MKWPTHYTGGALAGLVVSTAGSLSVDQAAALTAGSIAASIAPDVDAKLSFLHPFRPGYDHRSFPHSLLFGGGGVLLLALIGYLWLSGLPAAAIIPEPLGIGVFTPDTLALLAPGVAIGYLSHLALDAMTVSGIWLRVPRGKRVGLPKKKAVRTGSLTELLVWFVMVIITVGLGVAVFAPALDALGGVEFLYGGG